MMPLSNGRPTELPSGSQTNAAQVSGELFVSKLLMGFVERKVSPQTIADVVKAQIFESGIAAATLSSATCNGILEIITQAPALSDCTDVFLFMTDHPEFPRFLSSRAALGGIAYLLRKSEYLHAPSEQAFRRKFIIALDGYASRAHACLTEGPEAAVLASFQVRIVNVLKGLEATRLAPLLDASVALKCLHQLLFTQQSIPQSIPQPIPQSNTLPRRQEEGETWLRRQKVDASRTLAQRPLDLIASMLAMSDHQLALKGTAAFKLAPELEREFWKVHNLPLCLDYLRDEKLPPFHLSFLLEWFLEGILAACNRNEERSAMFETHLRTLVDEAGNNLPILKGILRALQKELSAAAALPGVPQSQMPCMAEMIHKGHVFLLSLVHFTEKHPALMARQFVPWALQIPVAHADSRLLTRTAWQWTRLLAQGVWEEDVRDPPAWIIQASSRFAAQIFRTAPHFWLQDHAYKLLQRLYSESLMPGFVISKTHFDYVEFLVRSLRRKSPYFASRNETLATLKILARLKIHEEQHLQIAETRQKMTLMERTHKGLPTSSSSPHVIAMGQGPNGAPVGSNTIARALHTLLLVAREAASVSPLATRNRLAHSP